MNYAQLLAKHKKQNEMTKVKEKNTSSWRKKKKSLKLNPAVLPPVLTVKSRGLAKRERDSRKGQSHQLVLTGDCRHGQILRSPVISYTLALVQNLKLGLHWAVLSEVGVKSS